MSDSQEISLGKSGEQIQKECTLGIIADGFTESVAALKRRAEPTSLGTKFDGNKADLSLIPLIALQEEAKAFQVGEKKYGRYNYCKGMEASRIVAAIQRHVAQWFNGEENDPVDGQHHLGAARAGLAMLLRQQELGTMIDNRYKPEGDNK